MGDTLARLIEFRDGLVRLIAIREELEDNRAFGATADSAELRSLVHQLNELYGELDSTINALGDLSLTVPGVGAVSHDVIFDVINGRGNSLRMQATGALAHVARAIGRERAAQPLTSDSEEQASSLRTGPGTTPAARRPGPNMPLRYRVTNPVYLVESAWKALGRLPYGQLWRVTAIVVSAAAASLVAFVTVFSADWESVRSNVCRLIPVAC